MKRLTILAVAAAALAVSAAALGDNAAPPSASDLATQACKQQQATMGPNFAATYGSNKTKSNAFGQCVAKGTQAAQSELSAANATCKAEQAQSDFTAGHSGKTFDQFYGANSQAKGKGAGSNAFGKCVSQHAQQSAQTQANSIVAAAKTCKAALKADATAFATQYGKSQNAFGKCVSSRSKSK